MDQLVPVFIVSRNRAFYLWACLDSLFKYTRHPCRFIFGDNGSDEPLVRQVIEGFERRGMFHSVLFRPENDLDLWEVLVKGHLDLIGKYFAFVESDVMVLPQEPCWLSRYVTLMEADEKLAMLGSFIDQSDFVRAEDAKRLAPDFSEEQLRFLVKAASPERLLPLDETPIIYPSPKWQHGVPGRLVIFRTDAVKKLFDFNIRHLVDGSFSASFLVAGYRVGIATQVRHRHLSLLNFFDYPQYDSALRDWFFRQRPREYRTTRRADDQGDATSETVQPPTVAAQRTFS
jgi:Glycosyl transferase family 2